MERARWRTIAEAMLLLLTVGVFAAFAAIWSALEPITREIFQTPVHEAPVPDNPAATQERERMYQFQLNQRRDSIKGFAPAVLAAVCGAANGIFFSWALLRGRRAPARPRVWLIRIVAWASSLALLSVYWVALAF